MTLRDPITSNLSLTFKAISEVDMPFLFKVYRSTRIEEMRLSGWDSEAIDNFLEMQFNLQHKQYMENYNQGAFDIIFLDNNPIGRLYINRFDNEIRIIDIALLPEYRNKGLGSEIIQRIICESEYKKIPISLHVEYNNPALRLYKSFNFEPIKNLGIYIFMKRFPKSI